LLTILLLKLLLVPALIYAVTLAGRRFGPEVAGWLSAFPIVSGPILLILALEQGAPFAQTAAHGTLLAVLAILVFSVAYAWMATRRGWPDSLFIALCCYALTLIALREVQIPLPSALITVILALLLAPLAFPGVPRWVTQRAAISTKDLPWRMLAAALLVLAVTFAAARLGPKMSGLLAMFPVMSTVLVGFSHRQSGGEFAIRMLRGMVYGYFAFAVFCAVLSAALGSVAIWQAFVLAVICAIAVHAVARRVMRK